MATELDHCACISMALAGAPVFADLTTPIARRFIKLRKTHPSLVATAKGFTVDGLGYFSTLDAVEAEIVLQAAEDAFDIPWGGA